MGVIVKHRKNYISHKKRWDKNTIEEEKILVNDYAIKNKKEIKKIEKLISKYKAIAKDLNRNVQTKESEQAKHFIVKLKEKGFLSQDAVSLDEILDIKLRNVLDRRLSNILYKNKFAKTPKQARQFIVHRHVQVGDKIIDSPSYLVSLSEEVAVQFVGNSALANEEHPERKLEFESVEEVVEESKKIEKKVEAISEFDEKEEALDDQEQDEVEQ